MQTIDQRIAFVRKAMGLSQEQFTAALNEVLKSAGEQPVTRGALGNWESGSKVPASRNIRAISNLSEASLDWLMEAKGPPPREDMLRRIGAELSDAALLRSVSETSGNYPMTVEVFGQAAGSTLGNGASILFDQPPIGSLPMLPGLRGLRDIFGLEVTGDSMLPMFRPGEPVYVSPHSPVRKDDPVILVERASRNGNPRAFIKILVAQRKDDVLTRQLHPPDEIVFLRKPGLEVHKVLSLAEALGYSGIDPEPQTPEPARFPRRARR